MNPQTCVIDYGMGNLFSVAKALEAAGHSPYLASSPSEARSAKRIVLPGVGAFGEGMRHLHARGFVPFLREWSGAGKPLLGICLGLQLLFEVGEEFGLHEGLGLFPGKIVPFSPDAGKVPHVGWNQVHFLDRHPLREQLPDTSEFYFVHSYHVWETPRENVIGETDYQKVFPSIVGKGATLGVQFHPEKSQDTGILILRNFGKVGHATLSGD
jgi:glutamine amidotransferase